MSDARRRVRCARCDIEHWVDESCPDCSAERAIRQSVVMVPLDATWPDCCGEPMWFRGGSSRIFYCGPCGSTRMPRPEEVRYV